METGKRSLLRGSVMPNMGRYRTDLESALRTIKSIQKAALKGIRKEGVWLAENMREYEYDVTGLDQEEVEILMAGLGSYIIRYNGAKKFAIMKVKV